MVGRVVRPWGIAGDVVVEPMTDNPSRFQSGAQMWVGEELCTVSSARRDRERWVVRFEGVGDRDAAEALRGAELVVDVSALQPLAGDQYYVHELIGCRVESPEGESLGTVTGVVPGPRDWLEVEGEGGKALLPMAREFLRSVDVEARRIVLDPPDGLIEATLTKG